MAIDALAFIKPDQISRANEIFNYFDHQLRLKQIGFEKTQTLIVTPTPELLAAHYARARVSAPTAVEHVRATFPKSQIAVRAYRSGTPQIIATGRLILGPTDPSSAQKWQVRGKYSQDSLAAAIREARSVRNVMHFSSSEAEGLEEVWRFLPLYSEAGIPIKYEPYTKK